MLLALSEGLEPHEPVNHVVGGVRAEDLRQTADQLTDVELVRDDNPAMMTPLVTVGPCLSDEVGRSCADEPRARRRGRPTVV